MVDEYYLDFDLNVFFAFFILLFVLFFKPCGVFSDYREEKIPVSFQVLENHDEIGQVITDHIVSEYRARR